MTNEAVCGTVTQLTMKRLCLADFDDTLILTDSLKTVFLNEKWFFSPAMLAAGVRLFFCRLTRKGEYEARCEFKRRLLIKYAELPDKTKRSYFRLLREKSNAALIKRIRDEGYDRIVILSASEENLIFEVLGNEPGDYEVIANRIPAAVTQNGDPSPKQHGSDGSNSLSPEEFRTCYGAEKIRRLSEVVPDYRNYRITVYTDSYSDKPLIDIANEAFLVKGVQITQIKAEAS